MSRHGGKEPVKDFTRVLLVEDSPTDAKLLHSQIAGEGNPPLVVVEADTLRKALHQLTDEAFDLILLDLNLPDSAGLDTLAVVLRHIPYIPIIVLTQTDDEAVGVEAVRQGAQDYLIKSRTDKALLHRSLRYAIERKRIETALQRSRDKIRKIQLRHEAVLRSTPNGLCILSPDWTILWANMALQQIVGSPPSETQTFHGRHFSTLFATEAAFKAYTDAALAIVRSQSMDSREVELCTHGHRPVCVEISLVRLDPARTGGGYVATLGDITERKTSEARFRENEEKYRLLVENSGAGIAMVSPDGQFLFFNEMGASFHGKTPLELVGKTMWDLFPRELADYQMRNVHKVIESNQPFSEEILTVYGVMPCWREVFLQPVRDAEGKPFAAMVISYDITRRKEADEALRKNETRFRSVLDSANDAILTLDVHGNILTWSAGARKMFGYKESEALGKSVASLVQGTPWDKPLDEMTGGPEEHCSPALTADGTVESLGSRADGRRFQVEISLSSWSTASETFFTAILRDISERKRTERERETLRRLSQRLTAPLTLDEVGRLLASESWELFHHDAFWFSLYDETRKTLRGVCIQDTPENATHPIDVPFEEQTTVGDNFPLYKDRKARLINRPELPRQNHLIPFGCEERLSLSLMFAPVCWGDQIVAVVSVQSYTPHRYSNRDLELLQMFADQCGGTLERLRIVSEQEALHRLTGKLTEPLTVNQIGELIARECQSLFAYDAFWIDILDPLENRFVGLLFEDTLPGKTQPEPVDVGVDVQLPMTPEAKKALTGQSSLLNQDQESFNNPDSAFGNVSRPSRSLMYCPIQWQDHTVGILSVQSYTFNRYRQRDLHLLESLANLCGGALARARAQEALRRSEMLYRTLVEQIPAIIYMAKPADPPELTYLSPQVKSLLGFEVGRLLDKPAGWIQLIPAEEIEELLAKMLTALKNNSEFSLEHRILTHEGQERWFHHHAILLPDEEGHPAFFQGVLFDITALKQAQAELERVHTIYRSAIQNAKGIPYVLDYSTASYEYLGEGCEQLLGTLPDQIDFQQLSNLVKEVKVQASEAPPNSEDYAREFLEGRVSRWATDYRLVLPNGEEKWLSDYAVPIVNSTTGQVVKSLGILLDITERKQAERELDESRKELQAIYDGLADGILIADCETQKFVQANEAICQMLGYTEPELLQLDITRIHPEDQIEAITELFVSMVHGDVRTTDNVSCLRRDGTVFYADINSDLIAYKGRPCIVGVFRDKTERRRAEEALRQSRQRIQLMIEQLPAIITTLDTNLRCTSLSGRVLSELNIQPKQMLGMNVMDMFGLADPEAPPVSFLHRALGGESVSYDFENRGHHFQNVAEPLRNANGEIEGILVLSLDITERLSAEKEHRRLQNELVEKERLASIGETIANVAHCMKNIFTALNGGVYLLEQYNKTQNNDLAVKSYDMLRRSSIRLYLLLMNMLDYSKKREAMGEEVQVAAQFEEAARMLSVSAQNAKVQILLRSEPGAEVLYLDSQRFFRMLLNLGSNAIDAMAHGGTLTYRAYRKERSDVIMAESTAPEPGRRDSRLVVVIEVIDTGGGIHENIIDRIFEPFYSTKGSRGTGLGLASAKQFVEEHGGEIYVISSPGKGTTVRIIFPPPVCPIK